MARYNEQLQKVWHQYEALNGSVPSTTREAVAWGVSQGMIQMPEVDPLAKLAEDMATALREEYATDGQGRRYRVNHAVRVSKGGGQSCSPGVTTLFPATALAGRIGFWQCRFTFRRHVHDELGKLVGVTGAFGSFCHSFTTTPQAMHS